MRYSNCELLNWREKGNAKNKQKKHEKVQHTDAAQNTRRKEKGETEKVAEFSFLLKKPVLLDNLKKKLPIWNSTALCNKHFKECYIKRGKRTTQIRERNLVLAQNTMKALYRPAYLPKVIELRQDFWAKFSFLWLL